MKKDPDALKGTAVYDETLQTEQRVSSQEMLRA